MGILYVAIIFLAIMNILTVIGLILVRGGYQSDLCVKGGYQPKKVKIDVNNLKPLKGGTAAFKDKA